MAKKVKGNKLIKLNLACGEIRLPGFIGVDIAKTKATDMIYDLTQTPWPWDDNSCDEIFCSHFFEHLTGLQRIAFMQEAWRILTPGSGIKIICPYYSSMRAVQDPTHQWPPICEASFLYFNKEWMEKNGLKHYNIDFDVCDFDFSYGHDWAQEWQTRNDEAKAFAGKHYINSINDIHVVLQARKPV